MIDLSGDIVALRIAYQAADVLLQAADAALQAADVAIVGRLDIAEPKITALETADDK